MLISARFNRASAIDLPTSKTVGAMIEKNFVIFSVIVQTFVLGSKLLQSRRNLMLGKVIQGNVLERALGFHKKARVMAGAFLLSPYAP